MTYTQNHDRTYWRGVSAQTLIEAARDSGHELAIALGERLEEFIDLENHLTEALNRNEYLRLENHRLEDDMREAEARLTAS